MSKKIYDTAKLEAAGFAEEEITLCNERFAESGFKNYDDWCRAYIALNSTRTADDGGIELNGDVIIKAMMANHAKKGKLIKVPKAFKFGSFVKRKKK